MSPIRYTPEVIELCGQLKAAGLPWHPTPGHFVWDGEGLIERPSPFHDRVYIILDLKHFLRRTGTMPRLIESMVWLPTWEQTRHLLIDHGVSHATVARAMEQDLSIHAATERLTLYKLLIEPLTDRRPVE